MTHKLEIFSSTSTLEILREIASSSYSISSACSMKCRSKSVSFFPCLALSSLLSFTVLITCSNAFGEQLFIPSRQFSSLCFGRSYNIMRESALRYAEKSLPALWSLPIAYSSCRLPQEHILRRPVSLLPASHSTPGLSESLPSSDEWFQESYEPPYSHNHIRAWLKHFPLLFFKFSSLFSLFGQLIFLNTE